MVYLANLPHSDHYKLESVIIVGVLPGPKEPKKNMNSYLSPLVEELLELWGGIYQVSLYQFVVLYSVFFQPHERFVASHRVALCKDA